MQSVNVPPATVVGPPSNTTVSRLALPLNAPPLIVLMDFGKTSSFNPQFIKALSTISVAQPKSKYSSDFQFWNAIIPIIVVEPGVLNHLISLQFG